MGYWNNESYEGSHHRTRHLPDGDLGKLTSDGYLSITGRVKSQFKLENGKYVSPSGWKTITLTRWWSSACSTAENMLNTFLIAHPNMEALRAALKGAGINASGDDALCAFGGRSFV